MELLIKCCIAVIIMITVHYLSQTKYFYVSALILGCPALSILAYYFMDQEHGSGSVRSTILFALLSLIPFLIFLITLRTTLAYHVIDFSLGIAFIAWLSTSLFILWLWNILFH